HQNGDRPTRAQSMTNLQPVHAWQHPIEDNEIRRMVTRQDQSHASIGGGVNGIAFIGQSPLKKFQYLLVVFDDQDAFVHGLLLAKIYHTWNTNNQDKLPNLKQNSARGRHFVYLIKPR